MSLYFLVALSVISLLLPKDLLALFTATENAPVFQLGYQHQPSFKFQYHSCTFATSGWSEWIPGNCNKCGQSRYRYCLGTYNGCGEWFCLGNRQDYCQSTCPKLRITDPRVRVDSPDGNTCGARATFSCPECYIPDGSRYTECLANSTWSHPSPSCSAVSCPKPHRIKNGYVVWGSNCGSKALYKCYYGYELLGEEELTCGQRGYWNPPHVPLCSPVKCPHLTRPENGFLIMLTRSFRARAYFRCRMGYKLHGPRSIRCSASGSWSPAPPACVRSKSGDSPG